ncbi:AAA family ATPase [Streptomyces sp. NPDC004237]|uniref:NACHT domain-containing protein n=1 Tax=Streptomyces sp. NPDC004237 TaxID=3154455 RepID=UPI0033B855E3
MGDYDLTRLGSREFEHLSQALSKCALGPGVSVFGDGKDGGREATFEGAVSYPYAGDEWNGYGVVQAKFKQRSAGVSSSTEWLERQIKAELNEWLRPESKRERLPEYLLFTTNVPLSAVPDTGGIARVNRLIAAYREQNPQWKLKGWSVWHEEEICRLLDCYDGVRRAYAHFVTPGDVLSRLMDTVSDADRETAELIRAHVGRELLADQYVRLGESGAQGDNQRMRLGPVAVDLRTSFGPRDCPPSLDRAPVYEEASGLYATRAAAYILERGDTVLRPSHQGAGEQRHILLIGGPGQGKSTLGQLVCQAYRAALMEEGGEQLLTAEARMALEALREDLAAIGLHLPNGRRWPVRVALNDYANAVLGGEDVSLLRYLVNKVNRRASERVTGAHLKRWLRTWPCVLVLDGLDEVASPHTREDVLSAISDFLLEARQIDADLLVVATTRPQGYKGEFHSGDYETLTLAPMDASDALQYAERLATARHSDDPEMRETVLARVEQAAREDATARLMRSPLQVTIMSLLMERRARIPQNRYELFTAYYDTIYAREVDKPTSTGQLLADHRFHIDWLHQYVGLLLQSRAAQDNELDAVVEENDLRERAQERLLKETDDPDQAEALARRLIDAATDRLVLLVAPDAGYVGFEVRSLQEYMGARALISGPEIDIVPRLESLASSSSWRNAWLLAAAGIFPTKPHLRGDLLNALRALDSRDEITMTLMPGARLALDLLDEGVTRQHPRFHNLLVDHATALIGQVPRPNVHHHCARTLLDAAAHHQQARTRIEHALKDALSARDGRLVTALNVLSDWQQSKHGLTRSFADRMWAATMARLSLEEHAAISPVTQLEYPDHQQLQQDFVVVEQTSLANFVQSHLPEPHAQTAVVAEFVSGLNDHPVFRVRPKARALQSVDVTIVEGSLPLDTHGAVRAMGDPQAVQLCLDVIRAQPITAWHVATAFIQLLDLLAYPVLVSSTSPSVEGIS